MIANSNMHAYVYVYNKAYVVESTEKILDKLSLQQTLKKIGNKDRP